jgi:hypothetical protein
MRNTFGLGLSLVLLGCGSSDAQPTTTNGTSAASGSTSTSVGAGGSSGATGSGGGSNTGGSPLFRMECEDAPLDCGWGYVPDPSPYYTMTHVEDGGPNGQDVVEFVHTPQAQGAPQVQYYNGWTKVVEDAPPQGTTRYARFWFKPLTPIHWSGTGDVWGDKFFILGDGTSEITRVICNLRDDYPLSGTGDNMLISCARNIDGEPSLAGGATLLPDRWNYIQIEIRSSSTGTAEDARIAMWFNSNDYDAPSSQSTGGFVLESSGWWNINLGWFAGTAVAHDGSVQYQLGGFEFDDEFDPSWSR